MGISAPLETGVLLNGRYSIISLENKTDNEYIYMALDATENKYVHINEYFPYSISMRNMSDTNIFTFDICSQDFEDELKRFKKYSQLLYSLNTSPNILSASDYFEENNTVYRVSNYINLYSLTDYVNYYNTLDVSTILNICFSLLDALWVIHCRNLTYGNVCPATIYICDNNCIKLYLDETIPTQIISAKFLHLTSGFASPELCKNHESFILKPQMDIYSFGALMYYITTGTVPAPATSKGSNGTVIDTGRLNPNIPPAINTVIEKAMQLNIKKRYNSVNEIKQFLLSSL
ncbi:MAG: protein kinase [Clostridium sp.]|nr:protein kinase [Clostridium sp.]MCM1171277.1 protein kinase [Clostridium sp.]MCM1207453.1 protein kinase [Ruminococcus sp.]